MEWFLKWTKLQLVYHSVLIFEKKKNCERNSWNDFSSLSDSYSSYEATRLWINELKSGEQQLKTYHVLENQKLPIYQKKTKSMIWSWPINEGVWFRRSCRHLNWGSSFLTLDAKKRCYNFGVIVCLCIYLMNCSSHSTAQISMCFFCVWKLV